jgi:hypothetical protein
VPDRRLIYATARHVTDRKRLEREILDVGDREKERLPPDPPKERRHARQET